MPTLDFYARDWPKRAQQRDAFRAAVEALGGVSVDPLDLAKRLQEIIQRYSFQKRVGLLGKDLFPPLRMSKNLHAIRDHAIALMELITIEDASVRFAVKEEADLSGHTPSTLISLLGELARGAKGAAEGVDRYRRQKKGRGRSPIGALVAEALQLYNELAANGHYTEFVRAVAALADIQEAIPEETIKSEWKRQRAKRKGGANNLQK
jgi:hypothetical protein